MATIRLDPGCSWTVEYVRVSLRSRFDNSMRAFPLQTMATVYGTCAIQNIPISRITAT
jgi:hypothetical protein